MQVTTNKQCRAPQKFSSFPGFYNWRRSVIHHCPTPGTFHTLDQLMVQRFYTKLWRVRRHQYIRKISSCPSFQHEHTSLFLAWTVQLVMYPMSTVAQQNRKRPLPCGYFQSNQDFYQQCYEAENLQTWWVESVSSFSQAVFDEKYLTCTEFPILATNHNSFH